MREEIIFVCVRNKQVWRVVYRVYSNVSTCL